MEKYGIPITYYVNSVQISKEFGLAFGKGCNGNIYSESNILKNGDVAMFGNPQNWELLQAAIQDKRNWYYGDKAYFDRNKYYRITRNAYQSDCKGNVDAKRWEKLKIGLNGWKTGSKILICQQSEAFYALHGKNRSEWVKNTIDELQKYTDRPIEIRSKIYGDATEYLFQKSLIDVHAVIVYSSVSGAQAAIHGIPCFATEKCASLAFGTSDLSKIENPVKPDNRYEMACILANNQWTLDEIRNGTAWRDLNENME